MTTTNKVLNVAETILSQLGGRKFIAMTGSKNFLADGNTLRMDLARNKTGVNKLFITLEANDTYTLRFFKCTFSNKTFETTISKEQTFENVYCDMLTFMFTKVTGLYASL